MFKLRWILLIVVITGVIILLLPDNGKPLIVFNKDHGPSLSDIIGLSLIIICWLAGIFMIAKNWITVKTKMGTKNIFLFISIYLLSCIGIAMALERGLDWILWPCVITALAINILFVIYSIKRRNI